MWFSDEAIEAWAAEPRATRGRQPWYSPLAILTALTLRAVFRSAFRQTEGLIGSIVALLGTTLAQIEAAPGAKEQVGDAARPSVAGAVATAFLMVFGPDRTQ